MSYFTVGPTDGMGELGRRKKRGFFQRTAPMRHIRMAKKLFGGKKKHGGGEALPDIPPEETTDSSIAPTPPQPAQPAERLPRYPERPSNYATPPAWEPEPEPIPHAEPPPYTPPQYPERPEGQTSSQSDAYPERADESPSESPEEQMNRLVEEKRKTEGEMVDEELRGLGVEVIEKISPNEIDPVYSRRGWPNYPDNLKSEPGWRNLIERPGRSVPRRKAPMGWRGRRAHGSPGVSGLLPETKTGSVVVAGIGYVMSKSTNKYVKAVGYAAMAVGAVGFMGGSEKKA